MVKGSRLRTKTSKYHSQTIASAKPTSGGKNSASVHDGGRNASGGFPNKVSARQIKESKMTPTDFMKGRLAIKAVTMNLSGQSVMGLTPAYKLNYIR